MLLKRHFQLPVNKLVAHALARKEGVLSDSGSLVIQTGKFTGRSPDDKFIVRDEMTDHVVDWNKYNNPISTAEFLELKKDVAAYLNSKDELWTRYAFASAKHRIPLHIYNELPSHNHFALNMFIEPSAEEIERFKPEWTIYHAPGFSARPKSHGTRGKNFTAISFTHKCILIGGTGYTGELKKAVFTMMNYVLPLKHNVLTMHCSANQGKDGDTALFFGLSGTGKTTLSADPERNLIGDDEHGWDGQQVFNLEGGCYAKVINLSKEQEPLIFGALNEKALIENVKFYPRTNQVDFSDQSITENTRASYPLTSIKNFAAGKQFSAPANIFFLSCDAYGVLPPVSKLSANQARAYYLKGYTAKIAGTENGVKEPKATFSACFGAPFLPLQPSFYASMLENKVREGKVQVWMINTGWIGGAYGVGRRIDLAYTRAIIKAICNGELDNAPYCKHPVFDLMMPTKCPGVPGAVLMPWNNWLSTDQYFECARNLKYKFEEEAENKPIVV